MAMQQPVSGKRPIVLYVALFLTVGLLAFLAIFFLSGSDRSRRTAAETQLTQVQGTVSAQETALAAAEVTIPSDATPVTKEASPPVATSSPGTSVSAEGTRSSGGETLLVPFLRGTEAISTTRSYDGEITLIVEGTGQAGAGAWSDAFYIFSDSAEEPITPIVIREAENLTLWINGRPATDWVDPLPPYNVEHTYTFDIEAPGGPLSFAVGDTAPEDNRGNFTITVLPNP